MRRASVLVTLLVGCSTEPLVDDLFTEDEWAFGQTFNLDRLTTPVSASPNTAIVGQQLFFDPRLSGPLTVDNHHGPAGAVGLVSCATCHDPDHGFADPRALSIGTGTTRRNAAGLANVAYLTSLTWTGQYHDLVSLLELPVWSRAALNSNSSLIAGVVRTHYGSLMEPFGGIPSHLLDQDAELYRRASVALAAYQTELRTGLAPFDRYLDGDFTAIDAEAKRGFQVFIGRGLCSECHTGPLFTDERFYNTGVMHGGVEDTGRAEITSDVDDEGRFRTPMLRQVAETSPYMHAGQLATLAEVIEFYRWGGHATGFAGDKDDRLLPLEIDDADARALEAFLRSLTGPVPAQWTARPAVP